MSSLFLLPRNRDRIFRAIVNTEPANLIGFWPLDETSGTVARDYSGRGNHGTHVGVTLGQPGPGDGRTSTYYDGSTDYTNVYSAALAAAFNGAEGTLLIWAKVANAGVWTDNTFPFRLAYIGADADNYIALTKYLTGKLYHLFNAGGTLDGVGPTATSSPLSFFCVAMTWSASADQLITYLDGAQMGTTQTGIGTWVGSPAATLCVLGASNTTPLHPFSGSLARCALWSKALTVAQLRPMSGA